MGKWLSRLPMIFGVLGLPAAAASQAIQSDFWSWFEKNQDPYFAFDPDNTTSREQLFDELAARLSKIDPDLVFEFGPPSEGKREFVISAGGIKKAFPAVASLVAAAPSFSKWKIIAFRPRRYPLNVIEYQNLRIDPNKIFVEIARDGEKLALRISMPNYTENEQNKFGSAGYLLLDEALGEYDVETKVSGIEFRSLDAKPPVNSVPLAELGSVFDKIFSETMH